jgi:threonine dehydratase
LSDGESILSARRHLDPEIIRTPLQIWRHASSRKGIRTRLKLESLQRTGSFKARGAWNKLRLLTDAQRARGVICASAGNHAQGVAFAAERVGVRATIVMPVTAPRIKIAQTRLYGDPEIVLHGDDIADAAARAIELQQASGSVFVHAYDDRDVIAGQATVGLEILEQCPDVDTIVVPVGGGGLAAGIALATRAAKPTVRVVGVQAKGSDAVVRALETGGPVKLDRSSTIADGINVRATGERPLEILSRLHVPVMRVTDAQIRAAMVALCQTAKLVVEPAGAASAAALLFHPSRFEGNREVVAVVSGANVNPCCYAAVLTAFPTEATEDAGIECISCTGGEDRRACLASVTDLVAPSLGAGDR